MWRASWVETRTRFGARRTNWKRPARTPDLIRGNIASG
jgi:hypothetical protein